MLSQVYATQITEEQNKLQTLISQQEKILEQFGEVEVLAFEQYKFLDTLEKKKKRLADHFEANKGTPKNTFENILVIFEKAKHNFDF